MTVDELAAKMREAHRNAPSGKKPVSIILFAIKYASELDAVDNNQAVATAAHLTDANSYSVEIGYGRKLAKYVTLNDNTP